jgi:hypothetical protein
MPDPRDTPSEVYPDRLGAVRATLGDALRTGGWLVEDRNDSSTQEKPPLLARRGEAQLAIEILTMAEGRGDRLIPLWSQAWLQAKRHAPGGYHPVAVVAANRVSEKAANAVMSFITDIAPDAMGGVMDLAGRRHFIGTHMAGLAAAPALPRRRIAHGVAPRGALFSDLNQWMLKVLLAPRIPEQLLSAPRQPLRSASALAAVASVSVMSASRLLRELAHEGYLDESTRDLRLVRVRDLLHRWQAFVSGQRVIEQPWRALVPGQAPMALERWMSNGGACWALFAAAQQHWFGFVEGVPPYAYVQDVHAEARLRSAGFVPTEPGAACDVVVRRPQAPQSVFRGMLYPGGRPATDILQVWLDVSAHRTRGREQAALIWRRVFEPVCAEEEG